MYDKQYNDLEAVRRSDLWLMNKSPLHFKSHLETESEPSNELLFGIAMHKALLEYEEFTQTYMSIPKFDRRTKEGKLEYENFLRRYQNFTFISNEDFEKIIQMRAQVFSNELAKSLLLDSEREEAFVWVDSETGEKCKMKADIITTINGAPIIVDYKTTTSCENGAFERAIRKYGYKLQAGMYAEGYEANTFEKVRFAFIAQEKTPPYAVRVYWCSEEFVEQGKLQFHNLLRRYHNCKVNDDWPGYTDVELLEDAYD
ncbi:PD-(D/E)XK nuclease-like domain-containing protein [Pseudobutyrivibrio sp.]